MTEIVAIGACTLLTLAFLFIVWDLIRRDNKNSGRKSPKAKSNKTVTIAQAVSDDWDQVTKTWDSVGNSWKH